MTNLDDSNPPTGMFVRDNSPSEGVSHAEVSGSTVRYGADFSQALAAASAITHEDREAIESLPSGSALLIVRRGPNSGARFRLDQETALVGRHPDADIFLDDVTVSRRHAEFRRFGAAFTVVDLGSLNGTYFDGDRKDSAPLVDGAEVRIGKFRLTFYPSRLDIGAGS